MFDVDDKSELFIADGSVHWRRLEKKILVVGECIAKWLHKEIDLVVDGFS